MSKKVVVEELSADTPKVVVRTFKNSVNVCTALYSVKNHRWLPYVIGRREVYYSFLPGTYIRVDCENFSDELEISLVEYYFEGYESKEKTIRRVIIKLPITLWEEFINNAEEIGLPRSWVESIYVNLPYEDESRAPRGQFDESVTKRILEFLETYNEKKLWLNVEE
ncbi:MAG: hypothetical protein ABWK01_06930 [Infirmifilum sp.]